MTEVSAQAASTTAERIVAIAEANLGKKACSTNSAGGTGYYTSCTGAGGGPEAWCADFAKWVWAQAGANVDGLTPAAGSFGEYGPVGGTPQIGDAVLYNYNGHGYADHVALVVAIYPNGTFDRIAGDEGNHTSFATSTVDRDGPFRSAVGSTDSGQTLSGYVAPRGSSSGNPYLPLAVDGVFGPLTTKALQWKLGVATDGIFGPITKEALQRYLHVTADGIIGPVTIRALQQHVGVTQDGIWGPQTTEGLQRALNDGKF